MIHIDLSFAMLYQIIFYAHHAHDQAFSNKPFIDRSRAVETIGGEADVPCQN
jgi:hypothetical protein